MKHNHKLLHYEGNFFPGSAQLEGRYGPALAKKYHYQNNLQCYTEVQKLMICGNKKWSKQFNFFHNCTFYNERNRVRVKWIPLCGVTICELIRVGL